MKNFLERNFLFKVHALYPPDFGGGKKRFWLLYPSHVVPAASGDKGVCWKVNFGMWWMSAALEGLLGSKGLKSSFPRWPPSILDAEETPPCTSPCPSGCCKWNG